MKFIYRIALGLILLAAPAVISSTAYAVQDSTPVRAFKVENSLETICKEGKKNNPGEDPAICDVSTTQTARQNVFVGKEGVITRLTKVLVWISGSLALIMLIIGGLMFMFSSGNSETAGKAKRTVFFAIIGMVVAVVAQLVVLYVLEKL